MEHLVEHLGYNLGTDAFRAEMRSLGLWYDAEWHTEYGATGDTKVAAAEYSRRAAEIAARHGMRSIPK